MDTELTNIVAQAELALLEERELMHTGPRFRVLHRFHKIGTDCQAGEEVVAVLLLNKAQEIPLPLSLSLRLVFNYLAEWRRVPQTATQIAAGIQAYAFYKKHGQNAGKPLRRKICRTAIKEHTKRIRKALDAALAKAGLTIDSRSVLVSENTCGNEVLYRLRASVEWVHLD